MDVKNLVESYKSGKISRRRFIATLLVVAPIAAFGTYWWLLNEKGVSPTSTTTSTPMTSTTSSTTTTTTSSPTTSITSTSTPSTSTTMTTTTTEIPINPELKEKFLKVLPSATNFKPVLKNEEVLYYEAYDDKGALIGYTFVAEAKAPTDQLEVVGAVDLDYKVVAVDVEAISTNVWKQEICGTEFENQFVGLSVGELELAKDGGKVDGVTGATMSSKAVTEAIKLKIQEIMQK